MSITQAELDAINAGLTDWGIEPITKAPPQRPRGKINVELTRFTKANGPLTKHISLAADGT